MTNLFQTLFSGAAKANKFPKISWGHRFEGIEYETENNSLYIDSTFIAGRKIFTDSIKDWKDNEPIANSDKIKIFKEIIQFASQTNEKPTVVINTDYEKAFWEKLCKESGDLIKGIIYESDKQKEDFQFNYFLDSVRKKETLIFGNKTIKTEPEFL
ncbi:MAG: hypothetical protein ACTHK0_10295, partial [Ginsengibacter sp.]